MGKGEHIVIVYAYCYKKYTNKFNRYLEWMEIMEKQFYWRWFNSAVVKLVGHNLWAAHFIYLVMGDDPWLNKQKIITFSFLLTLS